MSIQLSDCFSAQVAKLCFGLAAVSSAVVAQAQSSASDYTTAIRYDALGRVVGSISPDPDGSGPHKFPATRTTYDARGNVVAVETGELQSWKDETVLPSTWTMAEFDVHTTVETTYDSLNRKLTDKVIGSDGATASLTQYSYDNMGRLECTAIRMDPTKYGTLPNSACDLGQNSVNAPNDRITKSIYDGFGQVTQVRSAVGVVGLERAEATYTYNDNGQIASMTDARNYKAVMVYDGHDRQTFWHFPNPSVQNQHNPSDYEQYSYDKNSNRLSLRKRDGSTIFYQYDALNRTTKKTVPDRGGLGSIHERNVVYEYDLRGLQTSAKFEGTSEEIEVQYDGFGGPVLSRTTVGGTAHTKSLTYGYDANGNRTSITFGSVANSTFTYTYDGGNRPDQIKDPAGVVLVDFSYTERGELAQAAKHSFAPDQSWTYDPVGRMAETKIEGTGPATNVTWSYTRNPASQIVTEYQSNDAYSWDSAANANTPYTVNGLNQYTSVGITNFAYDPNGNLTDDGEWTYLYDVENRLVEMRHKGTTTGCSANDLAAELFYDPLGRLYESRNYSCGTLTESRRYHYDGDALVEEYDLADEVLARHIHGPAAGVDDPLVSYENQYLASSNALFLQRDARGSIVYRSNQNNGQLTINTYDEYGQPGSTNYGRFQYTGQSWLPELGMYYYKARIYSPRLGRFLQTDPVGYEDQYNLYAYVGNDPINAIDPTGESCEIVEKNVRCIIDDTQSFLDAGYSEEEVRELAQNYADSVAHALAVGDGRVTVTDEKVSFTGTGNEIAEGLANAYVEFDPNMADHRRATMSGGNTDTSNSLTARAARMNPDNRPYTLRIGRSFFKQSNTKRKETLIHEGLHTVPREKQLRYEHREPYNRAAREVLRRGRIR